MQTPRARLVGMIGLVSAAIGIWVWLTGVTSLPELLGMRRGVPAESARLLAVVQGCKFDGCGAALIQPLLRAGANPNIRTDSGFPLLHLALMYGFQPAAISLLLDSGADVNAVTKHGDTALMVIATGMGPNVRQDAQILIRNGCDVNAKNKDGWTALMFVAHEGWDVELLKALLAAGASPDARNRSSKTALDIAIEKETGFRREGFPDLAAKQARFVHALRVATVSVNKTELPDSPDEPHETTPAEQAKDPAGPPLPFVARGASPREGLILGTKVASGEVEVYANEGDRSTVVFKLRPYETYDELTGNVHVTRAGLVDVTAPVALKRGLPPAFGPGDTIYTLTAYGEGMVDVWFKGAVYHVHQFWNSERASMGFPRGVLRREPQQTYWVQVRNERGETGWIAY